MQNEERLLQIAQVEQLNNDGYALSTATHNRRQYIEKLGQRIFANVMEKQHATQNEYGVLYNAAKQRHDGMVYAQFANGSYDQLAKSRSIVHDAVTQQTHTVRFG